MGLLKYRIDGSVLSVSDREKLIQLLDKTAYTGAIYVDLKKGLYQAFYEESFDVHLLPFPNGTIVDQIP